MAEQGLVLSDSYPKPLPLHMATHSALKLHQCPHCEKNFNRKDHLKNHLQTHNPNKLAFGCEQCGKKYLTALGYKRHLALHAASEGDLTCGVCGRELASPEGLLHHLKAHAQERARAGGPRERKHRCEHCERRFHTRKDVRRHLVVHTGCKDFLCQFCAQRFGRKDHLTRHTKKTHPQELLGQGAGPAPPLAGPPPPPGPPAALFQAAPTSLVPLPGAPLAGPARKPSPAPPAPAALELGPLLGFWQLPPAPGTFAAATLPLGAGDALAPHLGHLAPPEQALALPVGLGLAPLPALAPLFPAGAGAAILPHFHHAFR
ncbi:zinc finger protein PLAGL1 isoform X2 [Dasypus novemcinctus]|uniref:zinc finger protein PLAGL1 isoform X2 n=1 Tax=Dasypus novemcinctus TaxID=9361 RepID=UPI00265F5297|nr:zinc finger protein PLAGL1 isoform X2 [Dasypus novemcinctus]